jgi:hypothetical protein
METSGCALRQQHGLKDTGISLTSNDSRLIQCVDSSWRPTLSKPSSPKRIKDESYLSITQVRQIVNLNSACSSNLICQLHNKTI